MTTTPMPILDAVFNLADNKRSGTLVLGSDKNTIELHFRNGEIRAASSDLPDFQIGRFLSKKGFIRKPGIVYLLKESRKKRLLLGEAAVKDRILNNDELSDSGLCCLNQILIISRILVCWRVPGTSIPSGSISFRASFWVSFGSICFFRHPF